MGNIQVFVFVSYWLKFYLAAVFSERHFSRVLFNEKFIQTQRWTLSLCYGWHLPQNAPKKQYKSLATCVWKVSVQNVAECTMDASLFFELIVRDKNTCHFAEGTGSGYRVTNTLKVSFMIVTHVFHH